MDTLLFDFHYRGFLVRTVHHGVQLPYGIVACEEFVDNKLREQYFRKFDLHPNFNLLHDYKQELVAAAVVRCCIGSDSCDAELYFLAGVAKMAL